MRRNQVQAIAVPAKDIAELGIAEANGILQHGSKHRLKITGRVADDFQYLRCCSLLPSGFLQLAIEQPDLCFLVGTGGIATALGLWRDGVF